MMFQVTKGLSLSVSFGQTAASHALVSQYNAPACYTFLISLLAFCGHMSFQ